MPGEEPAHLILGEQSLLDELGEHRIRVRGFEVRILVEKLLEFPSGLQPAGQ